MNRVDTPTCFTLYRFYATDDELLYVGLTINPGRRMEKHQADKPWWPDVARIAMEQHADLEALRAAERTAIETEKPRHNIRMNGDGARQAVSTQPPVSLPVIDGLVGRWFHTWRPACEDDHEYVTKRGDRVLQWQGEILERVEHELYLVETYSWMDGAPYEQTLIHAGEMTGWTFYSNHIEMIAALGCRESRERGDNRECGHPAEYLTVNRGLGSSAVCDYHAGYYSSVQPIVWKNGVATLGKKTKVPHPLSPEGLMRA